MKYDYATVRLFFFFNDTATTEIYTLSLHDALPAALVELGQHGREMLGHEIAHRHVSAGDGAGDDQRARLDPVGHDAVSGASERRHALDLDARRAGAADAGSHRVEERGEIRDLGLAGRVLADGRALSQRGSHHEV